MNVAAIFAICLVIQDVVGEDGSGSEIWKGIGACMYMCHCIVWKKKKLIYVGKFLTVFLKLK